MVLGPEFWRKSPAFLMRVEVAPTRIANTDPKTPSGTFLITTSCPLVLCFVVCVRKFTSISFLEGPFPLSRQNCGCPMRATPGSSHPQLEAALCDILLSEILQ